MRAARIANYGGPDVVDLVDIDRPTPGPGQVLVIARASSINPVDILVREGRMQDFVRAPLPLTLGTDVSGVVAALGPGTAGFAVGDEVFGSASVAAGGTGAFAEVCAVPAAVLAPRPRTVSMLEAAAVALTGASAVQALEDHLKLEAGQRILIHGGAGGIGSCAIQLAKRIGAQVTTTTTGDGIDFVRALGADHVVDYRTRDFTSLGPVFDAVLDTIGGDTYTRSFVVLCRGGTIVSMKQPINLKLMDRYQVKAFFELTRMATATLERVRRHVDEGVIRARVQRAYPLERIREGMRDKQGGRVHGKLVIAIS